MSQSPGVNNYLNISRVVVLGSSPSYNKSIKWLFFLFSLSDWQVWQCGGSVEVLPCSRIAHIERAHKPYTENLTAHVRRNALRVAEVWMDQHKSHVYMAWNVPLQVRQHKARARGLCGCGACTSACPVRDCCLCSGSASQIS